MFLRRKQSGRLMGRTSSRSVLNGTLVILLSFCILLGAFGWKNASAEGYTCGLEEHTHDDACYEKTLICDNEDNDHEHTDECYKQTLICEKAEHTHTDACLTTAETEETVEQQEEATEEYGVMALDLDEDSGISAQADGDGLTPFPGTTPPNTVVNLFDYWTTNSLTPEEIYPNNQFNGINSNGSNTRPLVFWYWSNESYGLANQWTGTSNPRQGIVQNELGEDGYPQINWDLTKHSDYWSTEYQTSASLRNANTSLAYLFNSSSVDNDTNKTPGKKVYSNVDGLFQVDQDGYYYYDCTKNYAHFNGKNFELYNDTAGLDQFFPFASYNIAQSVASSTDQYRLLNPNLNHYFGLTMTTRFVQDYDGKISAGDDAKQMIFDFSGDDDVWIFVDDVLVSDLGGIHLKCGTRINFATGEVIYYDPDKFNATKYDNGSDRKTGVLGTTTLQAQFNKVYTENHQTTVENGHTGWQQSGSNYIFSNNTSHTLKFFYMERGNDQSNMKLTTNLLMRPETSIDKVDQYENSMSDVSLAAYSAALKPAEGAKENQSDSSQYRYIVDPIDSDKEEQILFDPSEVTSSMVQSDGTIKVIVGGQERTISPKIKGETNSKGSWILTNDNGSPYTTQDLKTSVFGTDQIIVREINVPDGYRTVSDNIFLYFDQGDHLTTPNAYESGVWPSPNVLVSATNTLHLTKDVELKDGTKTNTITNFNNIDSNTSDSGTLFAVVLKRNGASLDKFENWSPVYGNDTSGYQVLTPGEGGNIQEVLKAYRENANNYTDPTFKSTSAGMQVTLTDLPGSLNRYYTYLDEHGKIDPDNNTEPQYLVAYYYSSLSRADLLNPATDVTDKIARVYSHKSTVPNGEGFLTSWSSTIQITNIENRLYFQKTDEEGNFVNGATFALYNAGEDDDKNVYLIGYDQNSTDQDGNNIPVYVYLGNDSDGDNKGTATINETTGTSYNYSIASDGTITIDETSYIVKPAQNADGKDCFGETLDESDENNQVEDGTGKFEKLKEGRYVLREISAPKGYLLNTELVKVLVNEDGVYANAGTVDDGVIVGNGAGFLIPTFNNCATLNQIDETLTWIYTLLRVNTDSSYSAYDNLNVLYAPKEELSESDSWKYALASAKTGGMSSSPTIKRSDAMVTYLQYGGNLVPDDKTRRLFDYMVNSDQSARTLRVKETVQNQEKVINYSTGEGQKSLRLYTDEGWSELSILQDYAHGSDQLTTGTTTTYTNLTTQNAYGETNVYLNIAHLFSNSTFVRVADPRPVDVELIKVDPTKEDPQKYLTGAEFILYQQTGQDDNQNPVYQYYSYNTESSTTSWVDSQTDATTIKFNGTKQTVYQLTDGTYYLKETKAPSGYIIETEPWKMVLTDAALTEDEETQNPTAIGKTVISLYEPGYTADSKPSQIATIYILSTTEDGSDTPIITYSQSDSDLIKLVNTKIYNLPNSGSFGVLPFILAGSLILGFSVYLLIREEQQTRA